jgi:hypothetical protein
MTQRTRQKIEAGLKAKIALEALREDAPIFQLDGDGSVNNLLRPLGEIPKAQERNVRWDVDFVR